MSEEAPKHTHRDYWWFENEESGEGYCLVCRLWKREQRIASLERENTRLTRLVESCERNHEPLL